MTIDITDLFTMAGIEKTGKVQISHPEMSGLEPHPKDDWLYLGLLALRYAAETKASAIRSAAFIGSGNGIETIAALKLFPALETIFITDLVKDIQPRIVENISANASEELKGVRTYCMEGRDCQPLPHAVDLIYGNLPLIMFDQTEIEKYNLSRTTLTDEHAYSHLSKRPNDILWRWSLLSQLGFLLTAKEKLANNGSILTLIGGRTPPYAIEECFRRAKLRYKKLFTSFKRQSDGQFLKQYAEYETKTGVNFAFYDYAKTREIFQDKLGITIPEVIAELDEAELITLLIPAQLSANEAYQSHLKRKAVGHIAHAFEAWHA